MSRFDIASRHWRAGIFTQFARDGRADSQVLLDVEQRDGTGTRDFWFYRPIAVHRTLYYRRMKTSCFEILRDRITGLPADEALRRWREDGAQVIVTLEGDSPEERRAWLEHMAVREELIEEVLDRGDLSRVLVRNDLVLFEMPGTASIERPEAAQITFVCVDRLVLIMSDRAVRGIETAFAGEAAGHRLREGSASFVVAVTLLFVTATVRTMVGHVKAQVVAAASKMDADSDAVSLQDISHLKQLHIQADGIVEEVLATLELVRVARRTQLDLVAQSDLMNAAAANINAAERRLDRLDRTIGHLQDRYDANQQDKTNRRLGALTVLSAIFMPLTLMAGLWGMNFAYMPELHLPWGYPGALALMVVVAGCLYWYFSSRGWLE